MHSMAYIYSFTLCNWWKLFGQWMARISVYRAKKWLNSEVESVLSFELTSVIYSVSRCGWELLMSFLVYNLRFVCEFAERHTWILHRANRCTSCQSVRIAEKHCNGPRLLFAHSHFVAVWKRVWLNTRTDHVSVIGLLNIVSNHTCTHQPLYRRV